MANELQTKLDAILNDKNTNLLPENLKAGVTCLGIEGTLTGGATTDTPIKLFETIEEMNADSTAQEGDLAIVYRNEIQNATVDSHFQTATFPDTVVLDTAITDSIEVRYRAVDDSVMFDCFGSLDSSRFMMDCYGDSGEVRIEYTSSDGITYTRTDTTGNPVDFGTEIYYEMAEMWNDAIGKFIQVGGMYFDGLYKYNDHVLDSMGAFSITVSNNEITNVPLEGVAISVSVLEEITQQIKTLRNLSSVALTILLDSNKTDLIIVACTYTYDPYVANCPYIIYNDAQYLPTYHRAYKEVVHYKYNLATNILSEYEPIIENEVSLQYYNSDGYVLKGIPFDGYLVCMTYEGEPHNINAYTWKDGTTYAEEKNQTIICDYQYVGKYFVAPTQFTLKDSNELLPGKIGYGKNGTVTGDGSIYNNSELLTPLMISNSLGNYEISIYPSNSKEVGSKYTITDSTTSETNMSIIFQNYLYRNFDYTNNYNNNIIVDNETGLSLRFYKYNDYYIVFDCSSGSNYRYVKLNSNQKQLGAIDKPSTVFGKPLGYNNLLFHLLQDSESGSSNYKITVIDLNTMTQVSTIRFVASTMNTSSVRLTVYNDTLYCCWTDTSKYYLHGVTTSLTSLAEEMTATETVSYTGKQLYSYSNAILNKKYFIVRNKTGDGTNVIDITTNKLHKTWSVNVGVSDTVRVYNEDKTKVLTSYDGYIVNLTDMSISSSKYTIPTSGYTVQSIYNTNYILSLTKTYLYEFDWTTLTFKTIFSHPYGGGYSVRFPFEDVLAYEPNKYVVFKTALGKAMMVSLLETSEDYDIKVISYDDSRESLITDIFSSNLILDKFYSVSSYDNTISPAEYEEINTMAEDVLGGVE